MGNSCHVGLQQDGSFYGDLSEYKKTLRTDLVWIESGKYHCSVSEIKLICEPSSIDTTYLLPCLKLYSKMVAHVLAYRHYSFDDIAEKPLFSTLRI